MIVILLLYHTQSKCQVQRDNNFGMICPMKNVNAVATPIVIHLHFSRESTLVSDWEKLFRENNITVIKSVIFFMIVDLIMH